MKIIKNKIGLDTCHNILNRLTAEIDSKISLDVYFRIEHSLWDEVGFGIGIVNTYDHEEYNI